uniref:PulJ/GspJ family protein n=1 Tax=Gelidibacter sp. TaxID=2018083 RepID=UPI00404B9039
MKLTSKIQAYTLSEMIVVLILTSIVVGMAFSVLTLVQKHMSSIQNNFNATTKFHLLEQSLTLDFNRFSDITYDSIDDVLIFSSEIETRTYTFTQEHIIKDRDTFPLTLTTKTFYFDGSPVGKGTVDAIKLETSKTFQNKQLFIYKHNAANTFMN